MLIRVMIGIVAWLGISVIIVFMLMRFKKILPKIKDPVAQMNRAQPSEG